jgi:hypothetical protein
MCSPRWTIRELPSGCWVLYWFIHAGKWSRWGFVDKFETWIEAKNAHNHYSALHPDGWSSATPHDYLRILPR